MPESISLCMIVKNEEARLGQCLDSARRYVDEIIIVDTGSTDKTCEIARSFTDKVYTFQWVDDFSAARNFALSKAAGTWILSLDADEVLDVDGVDIKSFLESRAEYAFSVEIYNKQSEGGPGRYSVHEAIRLFRNHPDIRFSGAVHEDISPSLMKVGGKTGKAPFRIIHYGYENPNGSKRLYLLGILKKQYENDPIRFDRAFYYGNQLFITGQKEKAWEIFSRAERLYDPRLHEPKLWRELKVRKAYLALQKGQTQQAVAEMDELFRNGIPEHEVWYYLLLGAEVYQEAGFLAKAIELLENLLRILNNNPDWQRWVRQEEIDFQLGTLYYRHQLPSKAKACFQKALQGGMKGETVHLLLGMSALLEGDLVLARKALNEVMRLNPSNDTARKGLAILENMN